MHYIPQATAQDRPGWLADGVKLLCGFGGVTLVLAFLLRDFLARLQGVSIAQRRVGPHLEHGFFMYMLYLTPLNAEEQFKTRALSEILYTAVFVASILSLWSIRHLGSTNYVLCLAGAFGVTGALGFLMRPISLSRPSSPDRMKKLLGFGAMAAIGSIVNALV